MSTLLTQYYWQYGIVSGASALIVYNVKVFKFPLQSNTRISEKNKMYQLFFSSSNKHRSLKFKTIYRNAMHQKLDQVVTGCDGPLWTSFWLILDQLGPIWTILSIFTSTFLPVYLDLSIWICLFVPDYLDLSFGPVYLGLSLWTFLCGLISIPQTKDPSILTCLFGPIYLYPSIGAHMFGTIYLDWSIRIRLFKPVYVDQSIWTCLLGCPYLYPLIWTCFVYPFIWT